MLPGRAVLLLVRNGIRCFSFIDAADAAHDAAHRQLAFRVGEKNLSFAGSAIAPTFEDGEVLHALNRTAQFGAGKSAAPPEFALPSTATLCAHGRKSGRPAGRQSLRHPREREPRFRARPIAARLARRMRSRRCTGSGICCRTGASFSSRACSAAASSKARDSEAWSRSADICRLQRFAARVEEVFHADDFSAILVVGAALEAGREAHLHLGIDAAGKCGSG